MSMKTHLLRPLTVVDGAKCVIVAGTRELGLGLRYLAHSDRWVHCAREKAGARPCAERIWCTRRLAAAEEKQKVGEMGEHILDPSWGFLPPGFAALRRSVA